MARGCRRFEAWVGPNLGASCWVSTGSEWIGEVERELRLPTGDCDAWNCVTLPLFRRRGLFRAPVAAVVTTAGREGFARAWIGCVDEASWTGPALRDAGFKQAARVELLQLAGIGLLHPEPAIDADPGAVAAARAGLKTRGWAVQPCACLQAAWSQAEALAEITAQSGRHFDPTVVGAFLESLAISNAA